MKVKFVPVVFLSVLFGIAFLSCAATPHETPVIGQVDLVGTEWERTNPPIDRYILVFLDKSNCMYVYPKTKHKYPYTVKGNKITIAKDTYELDGDILYYEGVKYFVKIDKE
jgi:hypothetical protein